MLALGPASLLSAQHLKAVLWVCVVAVCWWWQRAAVPLFSFHLLPLLVMWVGAEGLVCFSVILSIPFSFVLNSISSLAKQLLWQDPFPSVAGRTSAFLSRLAVGDWREGSMQSWCCVWLQRWLDWSWRGLGRQALATSPQNWLSFSCSSSDFTAGSCFSMKWTSQLWNRGRMLSGLMSCLEMDPAMRVVAATDGGLSLSRAAAGIVQRWNSTAQNCQEFQVTLEMLCLHVWNVSK